MEVKFKYGSWANFQNLYKDSGTLYFLDNQEVYKGDKLLSNIHSVIANESDESIDEEGFKKVITEDMRNNYYISLNTGNIKYVNKDLAYINISNLFLGNILLNTEFLQSLITAVANTQTITMPTLTVDGNTLVWTDSNVSSLSVLTPKQQQ